MERNWITELGTGRAARSTEDLDRLEEMLDEAAAVHHGFLDRVELSAENRAHAIYILQGSCITEAFRTIDCAQRGSQLQVLFTTRFINESIELMDFFATLEDDDRHLSAWFKSEIITRPKPSESKSFSKFVKALANVFSSDEATIRRIQGMQAQRWSGFSKYAHPTIVATRGASMMTSGAFDYRSSEQHNLELKNYTIGMFVIVPVLQALFCYPDVLPFDSADRDRISPLVDEILGPRETDDS